jgi:integral membrane protein (TIGR00529 family)
MVESLFNLLPDPRLVMAGMPAMIGMLPSPGGAVFSAPMVKEAARSLDIPPDQKAFINYWYRHIWEYVSPLYPGIILVSAITTLSFQTLALAHLPFALSVVLWGVPFGFRGISTVPVGSDHRLKSRGRALLTFVLSISPIIGTLLLVVVLRVNVVLSMGGVTLFLYLLHRYSPRAIFESLRESISLKGLFLVIGIMIFKEILEVTGALTSISHLFVASGLPKLLIITTIPFLAGLMTGLTIAFVAITFPILLPLMGGVPPEPWLVAIAFGSGFAGVMLSPVHLCLILTRDYFEADMAKVYRRLFLPSALVFASVVISWLVWS